MTRDFKPTPSLTRLKLLAIGIGLAATLLLGDLGGNQSHSDSLRLLADEATAPNADEQAVLPDLPGSAFTKLDGALNRVASNDQGEATGRSSAAALEVASAPMLEGDRVAISIATDGPRAALKRQIEALGGRIGSDGAGFIEAVVPVEALAALNASDSVASVRALMPPQPAVTSQGVAVHGATDWHAQSFTGTGVKIGIIDVGFIGYSGLIGIEVPAPVAVRCYTGVAVFTANIADCQTSTVHGTAVTETAVDVAPDSQIYIANPQTAGDLMATATWMASQGVKVINHSVSWVWDGPGDGTSPFTNSAAAAVAIAEANGILWVNAAGNANGDTYTSGWVDGDADAFHEFGLQDEGNTMALSAGQRVLVQARWDDTWGGATRDINVYLFNTTTQLLVAGSNAAQNGSPSSVPFEGFIFTVPTTGNYFVIAHLFAGTAPSWFHMQEFLGEPLEWWTASNSIANPADSASPSLLAVGATWHSDTAAIEWFSSLGPTRDGRIKPDIVGVDGADTVTYGQGGFFGTSQASPHVAGLAALIRGRYPAMTPPQVAAYLKDSALPRGPAGDDNTWGNGFAFLPPVLTVTVEQDAGQADPSNLPVLQFTAQFAQPVSGFAPGDVTLGGTANPTTVGLSGGPDIYLIDVSGMTQDGSVTVTIPAGAATGFAGEPNLASASSDNEIIYDATGPTVTVNQAFGQVDPTANPIVNFTAQFSEPVDGLLTGDLQVTGTSNPNLYLIGGGPTTFTISITGMTISGTVILNIPDGAVIDSAENFNVASTSTDNTVTFAAGIVLCVNTPATIFGTGAGEIINGTPGNDVIQGFGGGDTINGLGGNDLICGGSGADTIDGGEGRDNIYGDDGNDNIVGGLGDDRLRGGDGADTISGSAGIDILLGGKGADNLNGGSENDTLDGGGANDVLTGGTGNDSMTCGAGTDTAAGGSGVDTADASCETVTGVP